MNRHAIRAGLLVLAALAMVLLLGGCAQAWKVAELLADSTKCAIANQNLPNAEIVKRCAVTPENVQRVLELVGEARQQAALEAAHAAARQADQDQKSGVCR